jgi:hypothetical protein
MRKSTHAGRLLCDLVIAAPKKLHKAKPVTKRISHKGELAPPEYLDGLFQQCSRQDSSLNRRFDFIYDKIEMHRRPMPLIGSSP